MTKDSPLELFRPEAKKLLGILQKSMTNQAHNIDKCRVLKSVSLGNTATVRTAYKLGTEDARLMSSLINAREAGDPWGQSGRSAGDP
jgi:hypothetical protein